MPTFTHGKGALVLMDGRDMSAYFSTASSSGSADTAEVSTFGASSKAYIPGLKDATFSVEGFYAGGVGEVDQYLASEVGANGLWTIVIGDALGARGYGASVVGTTYEVGAEVGGAVAVSAEGQSTTGQEGVVVLNSLSAKTATGTGTQVDNGAASTGGSACYLHVSAASGTSPSLTAKVQHSADGSTWADLATFTAVAGAGVPTGERIATTGTVNRYLRAAWTISGTSPSFTIHLSAARL